jgi:hypothetical protein
VGDSEPAGDLDAVGDAVVAAGFGRIREREILRSLLALRGPDVLRDIHDEFDDDDDRREAFLLTERVLLDVVTLLRNDLDVPHVRLLPHTSVIPVLAALLHRADRPTPRTVVLLRRWLWRGAVLGADPDGDVPLRRSLHAVRDSPTPEAAALALLDALPPASTPWPWRPDLAQIQLGRALARVNALGLVALGPRELVPARAELPVPNPALAAGELLDTVDKPLVRILPADAGSLTYGLANRILHPRIRGGAAEALLAADPATRTSHGVDDVGAELLSAGRWGQFLDHRATLLSLVITNVVDRHAEWGARDRFSAAELLRSGRHGA